MSAEDFNEYADFLSDEYWQLADTFPSLMRASTFIAVMSLIEYHLIRVSSIIESKRPISESLKSHTKRFKTQHGGGMTTLEEVRQYIKTHTNIDLGANRRWKSLDTLNTIRNALVHHNGYVAKYKRKQVQLYAHRNRKILRLTTKVPKNKIVLNDGFVEDVLDIADDFFRSASTKLRSLKI
jgi:hypothetical protein